MLKPEIADSKDKPIDVWWHQLLYNIVISQLIFNSSHSNSLTLIMSLKHFLPLYRHNVTVSLHTKVPPLSVSQGMWRLDEPLMSHGQREKRPQDSQMSAPVYTVKQSSPNMYAAGYKEKPGEIITAQGRSA